MSETPDAVRCVVLLSRHRGCAATADGFLLLRDTPTCDAHVRRRLTLFTLGGGAAGMVVAVATDRRPGPARLDRSFGGLMIGTVAGGAAFAIDQMRRERAPGYRMCRLGDRAP